ncbi:MAG: aminopeptidase [Thiohalomonadales bacterium]
MSGCSSVGYYFDAINGHFDILAEQEPIADILQQEETPPELRLKLELAIKAREFASSEMLLPDNDSYRNYADIKRPYVVWNVIATEKYSIEARKWCFFVVGCVSYRGYFDQSDAKAYADTLIAQGYDVYISGAQAYSTLGWFDDPLLNTMIKNNEARLVGIIFHELAHQQIYIDDDSAFNEAFATSVEIEGVKRWFEQKTTSSSSQERKKAFQNYLQSRKREIEFKFLLKATQVKLDELFKSEKFKSSNNQDELKKQVFNQLQQNYQDLKKTWQNYTGYDVWMNRDLNNAHLALIATYYDKVPVFQAVLKSMDNDIKKYYQVVKVIGKLPEVERNIRLEEYQ